MRRLRLAGVLLVGCFALGLLGAGGALAAVNVFISLTHGHATATSVKCSPASVVAGGSTTCTATVEDTAVSGASSPAGQVGIKSSGEGSFEGTSTASRQEPGVRARESSRDQGAS